jgi:cobalt/nickel transport system permease protein
MSHIHVPDGVLPVWLWAAGYLLTILLIGVLWRSGKATAEPRRFALLGIFAAMMILVASIEIPPFGYHFNLSVVTGIILRPRLSVLAALMVNAILALMGHGGITVIGLNTIVLSAEMIAGYVVFSFLTRMNMRLTRAGFVATVIGLFVGTSIGFGTIALGSPWIDRALRAGVGEEFAHGIEGPSLNLARLAIIMFGVGAVGWVFEGILSAAILGYLHKVYPDILRGSKLKVGS